MPNKSKKYNIYKIITKKRERKKNKKERRKKRKEKRISYTVIK
jgi:hypothetical protein